MIAMTKDYFMYVMDKAIEQEKGIEVWVNHPDLTDPEIIINSKNNLKFKKKYYKKSYDDSMKLKANNDISITVIRLVD